VTTSGGAALSPFDPRAIDPETLEIAARVEAALAQSTPAYETSVAQIRSSANPSAQLSRPDPPSARARSHDIAGPGGPLNLRIVAPSSAARGVYMYFHGGGWVRGSNDTHDAFLEHLADNHGLVAISVAYRLAPDHPYPAAPDDCEAAALWALDQGVREFGVDGLILAGDSAGGHLAAVTALRLRARGHAARLRGLALAYGLYELTLTPSVQNWGDRLLVLNTRAVTWCRDQFAPRPETWVTPDVSPLRARLDGLPPALFAIGTLDPLLDDTLFMHARWEAAGNRSQLEVLPGAIHGFKGFGGPPARRFAEVHDSFLRTLA
jgi:acetyl esterase/lipase